MAINHSCVGARRTSVLSKSWLTERKEILQKIKDQVRLYLGAESKDVSFYAQAYKNDIQRPWQASDLDEIYTCLQQVQVVFGGDFHPYAQAQRAHLRIMRKMVGERKISLAVECLFYEDQAKVDQFLAGQIREEEFLKKINWEERWGFPWAHYKPIFDFAKANNIPVIGLNLEADERSGKSLHKRDNFAAQKLAEAVRERPEELFYVIYGDLHIAENHLPAALDQELRDLPNLDVASLYLNSEHVYFDLAEKEQEGQVEVVRYNDRHFCVLSSPPWVKWQSYLMYLEENFDVDLESDDESWEFQIDHTDHVSNLVKMICSALGMDIPVNDIEVYSLNDPQVLKVTRKVLSAENYKLAHKLMLSDKCYYLPKEGFFYLSKSTVNHAASLAGQYVHAKMSGRQEVLWSFPQYFLQLIWVEAMSFLLSKWVNPKRKAQTMGDLKKQLQAFDKHDKGREPLLLALDQKMSELLSIYADRERGQIYAPSDKSSYIHAARFIGEILGERYFLLYQKQVIDKDKIKNLLAQDLDNKNFDAFYFKQLKSLDRMEAEEMGNI